MCNHLWTYRNGRSECIRCEETADDLRGLPHGHYAINGEALTVARVQNDYACPVCLANIRARVDGGKFKLLCEGEPPHDVGELGRAIQKGKRNQIIQKQKQDFYTIYDGLPEHLRKEIEQQCQSKD